MVEAIEKLVPDTSVIIEGILSKKITSGELAVEEIILHEALLSELEHQANQNKASGYLGLDEIDRLRKLQDQEKIKITFGGRKPSAAEIKYAKLGEVDSLIRSLALEEGATLLTADRVQARVGQARGVTVIFIEMEIKKKPMRLDAYFDEITMSVHLREKCKPYAKKGKPGGWKVEFVGEKKLQVEDLRDISREIIEEANIRRDGFVEIERPGSTIVQLGKYRIVITRPPFSDGWEITAVRPVTILVLKDYKLTDKLMKRVAEQAEGILIAGSPGMGKSTFAQALATYYAEQNRTVKTVEAPRDLVLPDNVTQYAISHGDAQEIQDILLLSRPDNTLFDEMRNTGDFKLFADLRLAGIGMAGVVHATNPIDAIQRFVGRIELGVIPQVIDTVIFIKNGTVFKVLSLKMTVKVPSGMTEADLARPVVVVTDFETGSPEFELYSYGEETVVIPVSPETAEQSGIQRLAAEKIKEFMSRYTPDLVVEMLSDHKAAVYVPERLIPRIIGKQGSNIMQLEKDLGIGLDIRELKEEQTIGEIISYESNITKKGIDLYVEERYANCDVAILIEGKHVYTGVVGRDAVIHVKKKAKIGKLLAQALSEGAEVELRAKHV